MSTPTHQLSETTVPGEESDETVTVEYNSETGDIVLHIIGDAEISYQGTINLGTVSARTLGKALEHFAMCAEVRRTVRGSK